MGYRNGYVDITPAGEGYDSELEHLDGPGFAAWLAENLDLDSLNLAANDPNAHRLICNWRKGSAASLWTADELLIRYGRHPIELPAELFITVKPKRHNRAFTDEDRRRILKYADKNGVGVACGTYDITPKTLRNWRKRGLAHA